MSDTDLPEKEIGKKNALLRSGKKKKHSVGGVDHVDNTNGERRKKITRTQLVLRLHSNLDP